MPVVEFQGDKIKFPDHMMDEEIDDVIGGLKAATTAVAEVAAVVTSSGVAEVVGGLSGLAHSAGLGEGRGDVPGSGARVSQEVIEGLTYQPRTEVGMRAMQRLGEDIQYMADATGLNHMGGYWRDRVVPALQEQAGPIAGSALAAISLGVLNALPDAIPGGKTGKVAAKARRFGTGEVGAIRRVFHGTADQKIKAYHGSPHDFDEFKMSQIGTGEGAQAYGHGLYFAESEDVAKGYRDQLAGSTYKTPDGAVYDPYADGNLTNPNVRSTLAKNSNIDEAIERAEGLIESIPGTQGAETAAVDLAKLKEIKARGGLARDSGSMYQVEIDASPDELLDWDLPLSEQSGILKKIDEAYGDSDIVLQQLGIDMQYDPKPATGGDLMGKFGFDNGRGTPPLLTKSGIKGIKYKDGFSRGADGGTSNYVIFDDRLISISKKYGIAIPAAAALLAEQTDEDTSGMYQEAM